ncbi:MAG: diacylglycerol kinase [Alphaproteobacteria bacterium]|nr:diacylglycerol kinase [Alphaproteobacteria bacterium]
MIKRLMNALFYSLNGLRAAWRDEPAFRLECILAAVAIPMACIVPVGAAARALLIGSVWLVMALELVNTAIEAMVDLASPELHPLAKKAKDAGSAAVLLSCVGAGCIWGIILFNAWVS